MSAPPRISVKFARHLLLLLCLSSLAGAAWVGHRAADLTGLNGMTPAQDGKSRDILDDLHQAAIKRSALMEISEADLNRHLAETLTATVTKPAGDWVAFERLAIDLEPGIARANLVWNMKGHRTTATVDFKVQHEPKVFRVEIVGGSYGHLTVPRGMLRPLTPALESLSRSLAEEIQALFQMNQVQIAKDKLVLDPRFL